MANIGDKFIITIGDKAENEQSGEVLYRVKGFKSLVFDENGIVKLEKYEKKKGKWTFNEKMYHQYCCSECGLPMPAVNDYYRTKIIGCPYCLADMRG